MKEAPSYLVFVHPEIIPHLKSVGLIAIDLINDSNYITCSAISNSPLAGFLDLTLYRSKNQPDQQVLFVVSLPIQYVLFVFSARGEDVRTNPGFHIPPKDVDNLPEKPSR
jgi:hypothetical protein